MKDKGRFAEHVPRWGPLPPEVRPRYRSAHGVAIHACVSEKPLPIGFAYHACMSAKAVGDVGEER
jgi:hypothetical protein